MPVHTIVVAEDDPSIAELLRHHLEAEGLHVVCARDGYATLRTIRACGELLLLDVGLPGVDGFEVARTLRRERRDVPIVMLTARTDEVDRVVGLELGAEDYVCKPFSPREVVVRIKGVLRRRGLQVTHQTILNFGRLEIDESAREVRIDGTAIAVKPREFSLLLELASNPGVALSRERLLQKVWGFDFGGEERTVDVHVHRLRLKLESSGKLANVLQTVHGYGYKFARP
jgi:DNA-binding response OmpR family regulator